MTPRVLHTERLDLQPWTTDHVGRLVELAAVPEVARAIGRGRPWDPRTAGRIADAMADHWARHGFGWRAMTERSTGIVAGFCGVAHAGVNEEGLDPETFEFGCWVHPTHRRRGLGVEASTAVIDEAFTHHGAAHVVGCAPAGDRIALEGAAALGFVLDRRAIARTSGVATDILRLDAEVWARRRPLLRT